MVWLRLDGKGRVSRCHLRDASWFQWPLLEAAIEGNIVADFPLCNKSFNCSYSGTTSKRCARHCSKALPTDRSPSRRLRQMRLHSPRSRENVNRTARARLGRSLSIRQVDAGSCNGCELEIHALNNAFYDLERFGLRFVASPRHAGRADGHRTGNQEHAPGAASHLQRDARSKMGRCSRLLCRGRWIVCRQLCGRGRSQRRSTGRFVYSRVSTVSRGAFEWTVGTASTRKRGNGEPLKEV